MTERADAVVIGSGALGGSLAYLLSRTGRRVLLLDRHGIASQTSPRAAGLSAVLRPDALMTRLARRGAALLENFEPETGIAIGLHRSGSLKVARSPALAEQLRQEVARGAALGVQAAVIDAATARHLMPLLRTDSAAAIAHYPEDIYLDPALFTRGVCEAARRAGCVLRPGTRVEEILVESGKVSGVRCSSGTITAPVIIDAAGAWARALARSTALPMVAVRHQLLVTPPLQASRADQPVTRILDANVYVRPCDGGLMLGGYEATPLILETVPDSVDEMPLDMTVMRGLADAVAAEFPVFADLSGAKLRGGMPTMTLDDEHLIGPVPGAEGLFVLGGCNVGGLSTALAFAEALIAIIEDPDAAAAIAPLLPARFAGQTVTEAALIDACRLHYAQHYWSAAARAAM
ncbi:NAD(P)/FAD-dependent oxidoreductase [Acidisoma silvae]|uniref:FAD-dependent oxidoreductase n=1 Tax=Acidisoma silvae TaxID=2802396 RepID=A0A963YUQ7_9PROT|nr:FAD-dependent oxidoreductase [Acidisoma silvae]MCB8876770.1 FAD-dependent oxidoreductase [Acidisoma silvae]